MLWSWPRKSSMTPGGAVTNGAAETEGRTWWLQTQECTGAPVRSGSAEVTRWPHGAAAISTGLTTQPLKSHTEQGCPLFPISSLPFQVRPHGPFCEHNFLSSRSHLPTPLHPISDAQVLVAFSLLANTARSLHLSLQTHPACLGALGPLAPTSSRVQLPCKQQTTP